MAALSSNMPSGMASSSMGLSSLNGPPYPPQTAVAGGLPTKGVDVPICSVFLFLYLLGAIAHMTILRRNTVRGHKFILSGLMFGFCMARMTTQVMRIVWACYPRNLKVAIAAQVFTAAGVVLLYVVNIVFLQRVLRALHPTRSRGWHPLVKFGAIALYVLIVLTLAILITATVQSLYTLNGNTKRIDRDLQLYGGTFYTVISFLPILIIPIALLIPSPRAPAGSSSVETGTRAPRLREPFGTGSLTYSIIILLTGATLLCLGSSFKTGTNYAGGTRPVNDPAPYQSKACFYIFNFAVEILVIGLYAVARVDQRFFVPNGSSGPGHYTQGRRALAEGRIWKVGMDEVEPKTVHG